ncbi:MAG: family 10 glycosylhydrolase [Tannerella sp.]|jgi:hypothetical protein|nr:family 10 glycosylhydrolase [Tannerella sp.]
MKKYLLFVWVGLSLLIACSKSNGNDNKGNEPDIPINPDDPTVTIDKPVQMWIDAHANLSRFATKSNITSYLEKMKETGFNEIYVDVKPGIGYALYDSDILPKLTKWGSETVTRDWDYLACWIEEAEKLNIKVIANISTLGFGYTVAREGLIYDSHDWDGKTQMKMADNDPNNIVDIRDQTGVDAAMLDPCFPEVQSLVISIIEEIVVKYPKLKGVCLDYCRWWDSNYGFGDATISAFETYSGEKVTNGNDIITSTGGVGPLFQKWIEFRSMTVTNLVTNIRAKVKAINPKMELHLWASADWASRFGVGQNWASKKYIPSGYSYTSTYNKTGFADQLDVFSLGAYAEAVWIKDNPNSVWSVENFVTTYSNFVMDECKVNGSIGTPSYGVNASALSDAVYLCLKNTDGLMVFEISHVINFNQWNAIKDGISRVIKK